MEDRMEEACGVSSEDFCCLVVQHEEFRGN